MAKDFHSQHQEESISLQFPLSSKFIFYSLSSSLQPLFPLAFQFFFLARINKGMLDLIFSEPGNSFFCKIY